MAVAAAEAAGMDKKSGRCTGHAHRDSLEGVKLCDAKFEANLDEFVDACGSGCAG